MKFKGAKVYTMSNITYCLVGILVLILQTGISQIEESRMYIFGHSLIDHRPPATPTPSNETTVPHWMHLLAEEAGKTYEATGEFGSLPNFAMLPPTAQWGYDIVTSPWDSETQTFSEADFTTIMFTALNYVQWKAPNEPIPGDEDSPLSAAKKIIDWIDVEEPGVRYYMYENWAEISPFLSNGNFPPTEDEFDQYLEYSDTEFHNWWIEFHDSLLLSHPERLVRMIPVGPIFSELFRNQLSEIPVDELFEDDAPHGFPTIYFLAATITYMAVYGEKAPSTFDVPEIIHSVVADKYSEIIDVAWEYMLEFNDNQGENRVFFDITNALDNSENIDFTISPNPAKDEIQLTGSDMKTVVIYSTLGEIMYFSTSFENPIDVQAFPSGTYYIQIHSSNKKVTKTFIKL